MYDLIIIGGGIAGSMAAIAASRKGVQVLLIERNGFLGGALTASGVGPMMTFHAGDDQVIQGITDELVQRMAARGKSPGHILDSTGYTYTVTPFEAESMKVELEAMILEAHGQILYYSTLASVEVEDGKIASVQVCNKAGLTTYQAQCYIDASGDGDLSKWAGVACHKGRAEDGVCQPMTTNIKMNHVDIDGLKTYMRHRPRKYGKKMPLIDKSPRLSVGGFSDLVEAAQAKGELEHNVKGSVLLFETDKPGEVILNCTRVIGCDPTDPVSLSQGEVAGRIEAQEFLRFLAKYMPGFEHAQLEFTGPSIGIRSSRQIVGHYTLQAQDLMEGKVFEDTIAHSGYPIDIHNPNGKGGESIHLPWGAYYNIPYRILTNPIIDNLITVGRCVSATFEAQAAIRVSPTAGAIGHAGGLAAWLYIEEQCDSTSEVSIERLQASLLEQKGFLNLER